MNVFKYALTVSFKLDSFTTSYPYIFISRKVTTSLIPPPCPFFNCHQYWHVGLGGGRNQACQLYARRRAHAIRIAYKGCKFFLYHSVYIR